MKSLIVLLGMSIGIMVAGAAHAEPGVDEPVNNENNGSFLADLKKVGIGFSDPAQAISAGQAVCAHIHNGMSGLHLIKHLQENNPALTENGAAQFATISAKAYCPKQLDESVEPGDKEIKGSAGGPGGAPHHGGGGGGGVD
jgi:Protein of unknown function (DUF732)